MTVRPTGPTRGADVAGQTGTRSQPDRPVRHQQALALFLVAPQVLYAVNREVNFVPYATSFELADTSVSAGHWSVR
jgi:hypothetical protein